ncbi:trypsin-like peptidase domain-containing protein [Paenarthrobacter sp. NPDC090520]|uniref:trypsin-like peptidase domain-containing protein n=1 Tax=Paenarthrobacter sp. NPDC090520 TaxID=3364382 RepID=UPI00381A8196
MSRPNQQEYPQIPFPEGWTPPPPRLPRVSPYSLKSLKLTSYDADGAEKGMTATGFLAELNQSGDLVLVTNYHVVTWRALDRSYVENFENRIPATLRIEFPNELEEAVESAEGGVHWEIPLHQETVDGWKRAWFQDGSWWLDGDGQEAMTDVAIFPIPRERKDDLLTYAYRWTQNQFGSLSITDDLFVVGYPKSVGKFVSSTPIWTRGSVASEPEVAPADRFFIDSRTRSGQSGSPVIAYQAAAVSAAVPADDTAEVAVLHGVYSGRTDKDSDIGSVWSMEVVERIAFQIPLQMYTAGTSPFGKTKSQL